MQFALDDKRPQLHESVFEAPTCAIIGDVVVGEESSIWFGAVLRADVGPIRIGRGTSIQDNVVLHEHTTIGDFCTVGHHALIHGATVGNHVLIGAGSVIFNGCTIGDDAIIGLGAVVTANTEVPPRTVMLGVPAAPVRQLTPKQAERGRGGAQGYIELAQRYSDSSRFQRV